MNPIPLDLWAFHVHRRLAPAILDQLGHPAAGSVPLELVDQRRPAPPDRLELEGHAQALDDSGAAVADWIRANPLRGRQLLAAYLGTGPGPDLAPPVVEAGPGLRDLQVLVEHLATREIGSPPIPPTPTATGYRVKAHPLRCPTCGARVWSATPSSPEAQASRETRTALVGAAGEPHRCPVEPTRLH